MQRTLVNLQWTLNLLSGDRDGSKKGKSNKCAFHFSIT